MRAHPGTETETETREAPAAGNAARKHRRMGGGDTGRRAPRKKPRATPAAGLPSAAGIPSSLTSSVAAASNLSATATVPSAVTEQNARSDLTSLESGSSKQLGDGCTPSYGPPATVPGPALPPGVGGETSTQGGASEKDPEHPSPASARRSSPTGEDMPQPDSNPGGWASRVKGLFSFLRAPRQPPSAPRTTAPLPFAAAAGATSAGETPPSGAPPRKPAAAGADPRGRGRTAGGGADGDSVEGDDVAKILEECRSLERVVEARNARSKLMRLKLQAKKAEEEEKELLEQLEAEGI